MMILIKKAFRDLGTAKLRTISIIIAIMLSVGLGIGLMNATKNAFESFDKRTELTNYEDIDILFDTSNINISEINSIEGVEVAMGRMFIPTQVQIDGETFKTHWISSPYYNEKPYSEINGYQFFKGNYISTPTSEEALMGNLFAKENDVDVGDELNILYSNFTINLEVVGIVASPEYIYVVEESGWPQPSLLVPLFTTYEMTLDVLNLTSGTYNELLILVESDSDVEEVKQKVEEYLIANDVRITRSLLGTEEVDYQFSRVDAKAMGQMGGAFGVIILGVTAVVIYNSMTRLIATQRTYIGVMGALGGEPKRILLHYILFGFIMGAVGSILGALFGIGLARLTIYEYANIIGLLEPDYTIYMIYPVSFILIGIGLSTLAAFIGSLKALKIGPREALSSVYQTHVFSKKPVIERLFDKTRRKKSILGRVPLRNISRHKYRTIFTIIALALSMIFVFACLALALGFTQPLHKNYDNYELWDLKAVFLDKQTEPEVNNILADPDLGNIKAEPHLDDYIAVLDDGDITFAHIQAFPADSNMRKFNVIDGNKNFNRGILVGSILARDLNLKPSSEVTFIVGNSTSTAKVTGITGELMDDSFLMTLEQARELFQTDSVVNALIVDQGSLSRDEVETKLKENFGVASISYTEDVINGMESMMQGLISMFMVFILFGVIAEILFISTTVVLNILDREMEFISLRALGANPGKVRMMIMNESMILLTIGLIVGLPLSYYATQWAMWYIARDLMFYELPIAPSIYFYTAAIAILSTIIASLISSRHITKMKLVDSIRQKFVS